MNDDTEEFMLSNKAKENLKDKKNLKKNLEKGKSVFELMDFQKETCAKFYQAAFKLFEEQNYADASDAFLFLITLDSANHDYWLGLGMSTQLLHQYEAAIDAYEMAAISKLESPVPYFYLAKCLYAVHDKESSLAALNLAIEYSNDELIFQDLKNQAIVARDLLLKDIN